MKKLFLASEAKNSKSFPELKKFVGGSFKGKKLAYIVTAANGQFYGSWKNSETMLMASKLGANFKIIELENCVYIDIFSEMKNADILWFAGGQTGYLLYWAIRSGLDRKLPGLLEKGAIYIGSSAGSMACSKTQYASEFYIGEVERGASNFPGFGFIDFEIYPHYKDQLLPKLKSIWKTTYGELYLLKDGEAIIVEGSQVKVLGKKRVLKDGKLVLN